MLQAFVSRHMKSVSTIVFVASSAAIALLGAPCQGLSGKKGDFCAQICVSRCSRISLSEPEPCSGCASDEPYLGHMERGGKGWPRNMLAKEWCVQHCCINHPHVSSVPCPFMVGPGL